MNRYDRHMRFLRRGVPVLTVGLGLLLSLSLSGCLFFGGSSPDPDPDGGKNASSGDELAHARVQSSLFPNEPYWPYRVGSLCVAQDSLAAAESAFSSALLIDPVYSPALTALAGLYYETGRFGEGVLLLEDAKGQLEGMGAPVPVEHLEGLALHLEAVNDPAAAAETFRLAEASAEPVSPSVGVYLGLRGSDYQGSVEPARHAVAGNPRSPIHLNNLGVAQLQAGDPIQARELFREAHQLDPNLPGPLYNLALLEEFYLMDHEAGAEWFDHYWNLSQDDPDNLREVFLGSDSGTISSIGGQ